MAKPPPRGPKTLDHKTRGWLFLTCKSCVQYLSSLFLGLNQGGSLSVPTITPVDLQKSTGMGGGLPQELAGDICQEEQSLECLGAELASVEGLRGGHT